MPTLYSESTHDSPAEGGIRRHEVTPTGTGASCISSGQSSNPQAIDAISVTSPDSSTQNPPCQFAYEASTVFAVDKFADAEAMSPKDRADHVEANTAASWDELPEGAREVAQAIATNLEWLIEQRNDLGSRNITAHTSMTSLSEIAA